MICNIACIGQVRHIFYEILREKALLIFLKYYDIHINLQILKLYILILKCVILKLKLIILQVKNTAEKKLDWLVAF